MSPSKFSSVSGTPANSLRSFIAFCPFGGSFILSKKRSCPLRGS